MKLPLFDLKNMFYGNKYLLDVTVGNIAKQISPLDKEAKILDAFNRFMEDEELSILPIVEGEYLVGQLHRSRFLEHTILGKYGFGIHLHNKKKLYEVMEKPSLVVEANLNLEEVALMVQKRDRITLYDDIIVSVEKKYLGVLPINILLQCITQKTILLAKDANPLTGLPGNWAIQREVESRIREGEKFEVVYLDLNNFKPYNDCYGFEMGDKVIMELGNIIKKHSKDYEGLFAGHIGGDDFILICPSGLSEEICTYIIKDFESLLPIFHKEDFSQGRYTSINRLGELEVFPLLSLTCAIVVRNEEIKSYAQLASIASEVKAYAKKLSKVTGKSIVFKDRRGLTSLCNSSLTFSNNLTLIRGRPLEKFE